MKRFLIVLLLLAIQMPLMTSKDREVPSIGAQVFIEPGQTEEEIDGYFRILADNNMDVARIRLFGSHVLMPDGSWDFSLYDTAFDAAEKYDIRLFITLFPPTDPTADVGGFKFPFSKTHLEDIGKYIEAAVTRYRDRPALDTWVLQNEPGNGGGRLPESDLLDEMRIRWREGHPAVTQQGSAPLAWNLDEEEFHNWCIAEYLRWISETVRKYDSRHGLHVNPHQLLDNLKEYDFDTYEEFLTSLGVSMHMSWHFGYFDRCQFPLGISVMSDIVRSAAGDNPFWITEMQGGNVIFSGNRILCPTGQEIEQWLWTGIGSGAEGVIFWMLNPRAAILEAGEWAMLDYKGEPSDRLTSAASVAAALRDNGRLFASSAPVKGDITILYNKESLWTQSWMADSIHDNANEGRKKSAVIKSVLGAYEALSVWGTMPEICEMQEYCWDDPEGKCIILPDMVSLPSDCIPRITEFVRNGGKLIATGLTGYFNESMQCMFMKDSPLEECLGGKLKEFKAMETPYFSIEFDGTGTDVPAHMWKGIIEPVRSEVIARDGDDPVATVNSYGKGEAVWIPSLIDLGAWEKDILPLARLYGHFCEKQIQDFPLSLASPAENVIIRQMTSGDSIIAVIVNKNSSETELEFDGPIPDNARLLYGNAMPEGSWITLDPEECIVMTYRK